MLGQARQFISEDRSLDQSRCLLLRADVGRLPFATGSGEGPADTGQPQPRGGGRRYFGADGQLPLPSSLAWTATVAVNSEEAVAPAPLACSSATQALVA